VDNESFNKKEFLGNCRIKTQMLIPG
jgi:hypothetical protein